MQLTIEKLIYGGDGLTRLAPDEHGKGKTCFVPFVLEGERVEAEIVEERPGFARARATEIVAPSPERVEPRCPYFASCGGCHYQHTSYEHQLAAKRSILLETLRRTAHLELPCELQVVSAEPWNFRNRTRMKLRVDDGEFAIGYFRHGSHELLPVRECPISSPLINRALGVIWSLADEFSAFPALREVQFFASHDDTSLLLELYVDRNSRTEQLEPLVEALHAAMPELAGVVAFLYSGGAEEEDRPPIAAAHGGGGTAFGASHLTYRVGEFDYRVSAGSFFQTNRFLTARLQEIATAGLSGHSALDLYAGAGLFSLALEKNFEQVTAVESSAFSASDLRTNAVGRNIKPIESTTEQFLTRRGGRYDVVLADPPRAGLGERTVRALARLHTSQLIYVSCDPSTLSRDLRLLLELGFRVEQAHLVDMFPQTFHMESVFHLKRIQG